jgi:hypothetical protein
MQRQDDVVANRQVFDDARSFALLGRTGAVLMACAGSCSTTGAPLTTISPASARSRPNSSRADLGAAEPGTARQAEDLAAPGSKLRHRAAALGLRACRMDSPVAASLAARRILRRESAADHRGHERHLVDRDRMRRRACRCAAP